MSFLTDNLDGDFEEMISDLPCTLTRTSSYYPEWAEKEIIGTRGEIEKVPRTEPIEDFDDIDLVAAFPINDFADEGLDVPTEKETVTVDGVNYYIARKILSQEGVDVTFALKRQ
jgi:hypothetical protein